MSLANHRTRSESSPKEVLHQLTVEHLPEQDELEFRLGDTLDIKMSIFLVAIVFLATQSGGFLAIPAPFHWHIIQICSIIVLAVSLGLALWELKPRTYDVRMTNEDLLGWVDQLRVFYKDDDSKIIEQIEAREIQRMRERIAANRAINKTKSSFTGWCFWATVIAAALNALTLISQSTGWRF